MDKARPLDSITSSIVAAAGKTLRTTNRFFVLRASSPFLEYFATDAARAPKKGALDLAKCRGVNPDAQIPGIKSTKAHTFSLEIEDQVVFLNAGSKELMEEWIEKITAHIKTLESANNQGARVVCGVCVCVCVCASLECAVIV
jgi:hypothetical protein